MMLSESCAGRWPAIMKGSISDHPFHKHSEQAEKNANTNAGKASKQTSKDKDTFELLDTIMSPLDNNIEDYEDRPLTLHDAIPFDDLESPNSSSSQYASTPMIGCATPSPSLPSFPSRLIPMIDDPRLLPKPSQYLRPVSNCLDCTKSLLQSYDVSPAPKEHRVMTVVLDLDETLVDARGEYIVLRPYAVEFLRYLRLLGCDVVVWTAGQRDHAESCVLALDPKQQYISYCIYRGLSWVPTPSDYTKDLRLLNRDLADVVIIENTPECVRMNPANAILVPDFRVAQCHDWERDCALHQLTDAFHHLFTAWNEQSEPVDSFLPSHHCHMQEYSGGSPIIGRHNGRWWFETREHQSQCSGRRFFAARVPATPPSLDVSKLFPDHHGDCHCLCKCHETIKGVFHLVSIPLEQQQAAKLQYCSAANRNQSSRPDSRSKQDIFVIGQPSERNPPTPSPNHRFAVRPSEMHMNTNLNRIKRRDTTSPEDAKAKRKTSKPAHRVTATTSFSKTSRQSEFVRDQHGRMVLRTVESISPRPPVHSYLSPDREELRTRHLR